MRNVPPYGRVSAVQGDAVQDRAHRVLADAEVQHPPVRPARELLGLVLGRDEGRLALRGGEVGLGQVGRAAPQLGQHRCDRGQHLAGGLAGGHPLAGRPGSSAARRSSRPAAPGRQPVEQRLARPASASRPGVEALLPLGVQPPRRARATLRACASTSVGDVEGLVRVQPEHPLGRRHLLGAERRAVRLAGVLRVRRGPGDDRAQPDERRPAGLRLGRLQRRLEGRHVLDVRPVRPPPVDVLDVPAVRLVAPGDVLAERDVGVVLDGDLVVVVDQREVAELLVAGDARTPRRRRPPRGRRRRRRT